MFMATYSNTLLLRKPTTDVTNCGTNYNLGPTDPLDVSKLSSRPNRGKIRGQLKDYVLLMLGAPVVQIELDEQQLDLAVDHALQILEEWAPREFFRYYVFNTVPGKSIYEMPIDVGYVRNVFYKETGTFAFQSSEQERSYLEKSAVQVNMCSGTCWPQSHLSHASIVGHCSAPKTGG